MGLITGIKPQKKKKDRVSLFVNGQFVTGLSLEIALKNKLKVGEKISSEKLEELIQENELDQMMAKVYKLLSKRPRSEKEISDYLTKKKAGPVLKDLVIKKLKKQKYLDDEEFACWWLEQRASFRPRGKWVLQKELFKKGINRKIIDKVLKSNLSRTDSKELALKAARKKQARYQKLGKYEFRKKMGAFLNRRGFDWEIIKEVLEEIEPLAK